MNIIPAVAYCEAGSRYAILSDNAPIATFTSSKVSVRSSIAACCIVFWTRLNPPKPNDAAGNTTDVKLWMIDI